MLETYIDSRKQAPAAQKSDLEGLLAEQQEKAKTLQIDLGRRSDEVRRKRAELPAYDASLQKITFEIRQYQLQELPTQVAWVNGLASGQVEELKQRARTDLQLRTLEARTILGEQKEIWDKEKAALERRAAELVPEQQKIEERLAERLLYCLALQKIGISRTVASFLLWIGNAIVAGSVLVLSSLIERHRVFKSHIDQVLDSLQALVFGTQMPRNIWSVLLTTAGVTLAITILFIVIAVCLQFLRRFTGPNEPRQFRNLNGRKPQNRAAFIFDKVTGLVLPDSLTSFTANGWRSAAPFVIVALAIFLFALAALPPKLELHSETDAVALALVLAFISIGTIGGTLLFGPAIEWLLRVGITSSERLRPSRLLFAAIALVACVILSTSIVLGFGPYEPNRAAGELTTNWPLVSVAVSLFLGGLALPFGIVLRGIYRDVEFLQTRREFFRYQIAELRAEPTSIDLFLNQGGAEEALRSWRSSTALADRENAALLREMFCEDPEDISRLLRAKGEGRDDSGGSKPYSPVRSKEEFVRYRLDHPESMLFFWRVEPQLAGRFGEQYASRLEAKKWIEDRELVISEVKEDLSHLQNSISQLKQELAKVNRELSNLEVKKASKLQDLTLLKLDDESLFREACFVTQKGSSFFGPAPARAYAAAGGK